MVIRLPYQIKKLSNILTLKTTFTFDEQWTDVLCQYMMLQLTPYVRKQVRKLLTFICGSKEKYRQTRDFHSANTYMKEINKLCLSNTPASDDQTEFLYSFSYDNTILLIENLKSVLEIATNRTSREAGRRQSGGGQERRITVELVLEGGAAKEKKEDEKQAISYALAKQLIDKMDTKLLSDFIRTFLLESNNHAASLAVSRADLQNVRELPGGLRAARLSARIDVVPLGQRDSVRSEGGAVRRSARLLQSFNSDQHLAGCHAELHRENAEHPQATESAAVPALELHHLQQSAEDRPISTATTWSRSHVLCAIIQRRTIQNLKLSSFEAIAFPFSFDSNLAPLSLYLNNLEQEVYTVRAAERTSCSAANADPSIYDERNFFICSACGYSAVRRAQQDHSEAARLAQRAGHLRQCAASGVLLAAVRRINRYPRFIMRRDSKMFGLQTSSSGKCYGCSTASIEHCITLLKGLAVLPAYREAFCANGLLKILIDQNLKLNNLNIRKEVRQLLSTLLKDNLSATKELEQIINVKIDSLTKSDFRSQLNFVNLIKNEVAFLSNALETDDAYWEIKLRCLMRLFFVGINEPDPNILNAIILPSLRIITNLIKVDFAFNVINDHFSVCIDDWLKAGRQSFQLRQLEIEKGREQPKNRERQLQFKYFNCWKIRARSGKHLISISSHQLIKNDWDHWKYYLALKGLLQHLGRLINVEIERLLVLDDENINSDLSDGLTLKLLVDLLISFVDVDLIRHHYKSKLVVFILNGYLSLRKLVVRRTKIIDETQDNLLELLEEMTTGTESETTGLESQVPARSKAEHDQRHDQSAEDQSSTRRPPVCRLKPVRRTNRICSNKSSRSWRSCWWRAQAERRTGRRTVPAADLGKRVRVSAALAAE
ncbi:hypothetical protein L1887_63337 [Cichorium endivia]|nr:hypothetical protein L1887_63337 [Cichorium endivia]